MMRLRLSLNLIIVKCLPIHLLLKLKQAYLAEGCQARRHRNGIHQVHQGVQYFLVTKVPVFKIQVESGFRIPLDTGFVVIILNSACFRPALPLPWPTLFIFIRYLLGKGRVFEDLVSSFLQKNF
jgi:hypothetical protein